MSHHDKSCPHCGLDRDQDLTISEGAGQGSWMDLAIMAIVFPLAFGGAALWENWAWPGFDIALEIGRTEAAIGLSLAILGGIAIHRLLTRRSGTS